MRYRRLGLFSLGVLAIAFLVWLGRPTNFRDLEASMARETPTALTYTRTVNRAKTRAQWPAQIALSCAAAPSQSALPTLTLHGEDHFTEYCRLRREVLIAGLSHTSDPLLVVYEGIPYDVAYPLVLDGPSGLDARMPQGLAQLLYSYRGLLLWQLSDYKTWESSTETYFRSIVLNSATRDVLMANRTRWIEEDKRVPFTLANLAHAVDVNDSEWPELEKTLLENPTVILAVVRKWTLAMAEELERRGPTLGIAVPVDLRREVLALLRDLDQAALPNGTTAQLRQEIDAAFHFLSIEWRDVLMAKGLATIYCANLRLPQPRKAVHAVIGASHLPGIARLLETATRAAKIELTTFDGSILSNVYEVLRGKPDEASGLYPTLPLIAENIDGRFTALSMHEDGIRFALLMDTLDPTPGTLMNQAGTVLTFGKPERIASHFHLKPGEAIPQAALNRIHARITQRYSRAN